MADQSTRDTLFELAATVRARRSTGERSYTRKLLDAGTATCARKLGEEALELMIASLSEDDAAVRAEAADLLYHLVVLLEARHIGLEEVMSELAGRMGTSGLDEKASRTARDRNHP